MRLGKRSWRYDSLALGQLFSEFSEYLADSVGTTGLLIVEFLLFSRMPSVLNADPRWHAN